MKPDGRSLYVYYRVPEARLPDLLPRLVSAQRECQARLAGLQAELLRRPQAADGLVTVMETYAAAGGLDEAAQRFIEARLHEAFTALALDAPRHVEVFERLA